VKVIGEEGQEVPRRDEISYVIREDNAKGGYDTPGTDQGSQWTNWAYCLRSTNLILRVVCSLNGDVFLCRHGDG
jgi:hypothetical protein